MVLHRLVPPKHTTLSTHVIPFSILVQINLNADPLANLMGGGMLKLVLSIGIPCEYVCEAKGINVSM